MRKNKIENILAGVSPAEKKGILNNLVSTLLSELNEAEKKEIIKTIISGRKESKQLESMVEYWIKECTDSGVNPIEMSKEVLSIASHSYELATYSTPELRGLFNDWVSEIEREIIAFLKNKKTVDPDEVAKKFRLKKESVIFILGKLAGEGKIKMKASGTKS